nr:DUF551 domain-containing protein [Klebsiella pneumoniae]
MTKSTITRERLEALANAEYCKSNPGAWLLGLKEVNELARMALAAMDSEPVAYISKSDFDAGYLHILARRDFNKACTMPVYAAQPAPVVPEEWTIADAVKFCKETGRQDAGAAMDAWNACRAAMLQELQKSAGTEATCRGNENAQVLNTIKAPPALGSLPKTGEVQNTNSPVIPDGYVMVPKEPTDEMIAAAMNCEDVLFNSDDSFCVQFGNIYEAMLAAAPQSPGSEPATVPGKWIPVSERMPEDEQEVLTINKMGHRFVSFFDKHSGLFFDRLDAPAACCIEHVLVTHWMPPPCAPQEVK